MVLHGYEEIDHTADLALRVWGVDFLALLKCAAEGMYDLMGITLNDDIPIKNTFQIENDSLETMLVDFLSELLYLCDEKQEAFIRFAFIFTQEWLTVQGSGYKVGANERNIKAVTYHDLVIKVTETGMETAITFDV